MLAPDARAVLLDLLRPPADHRLSAGVATTFTLDFTAALVAPLAFAVFEARSSTDPVAILEAVRSCSERLDVFCQAGQITVPLTAVGSDGLSRAHGARGPTPPARPPLPSQGLAAPLRWA